MKTTEQAYREFPSAVRASFPLYVRNAGPQARGPPRRMHQPVYYRVPTQQARVFCYCGLNVVSSQLPGCGRSPWAQWSSGWRTGAPTRGRAAARPLWTVTGRRARGCTMRRRPRRCSRRWRSARAAAEERNGAARPRLHHKERRPRRCSRRWRSARAAADKGCLRLFGFCAHGCRTGCPCSGKPGAGTRTNSDGLQQV